MWYKVNELSRKGYSQSQISLALCVNRATVHRYQSMSEADFNDFLHKEAQRHGCKLDAYRDFIIQELRDAPFLSSMQVLDHLKESNPDLWETLQNRAVRYQGDNTFAVVVNNSFYEAEIKLHLIEMLTFLRNVSGQPLLNCHVEVEQVEHEALIYHPRDKYDTMLKSNPALEHFRVLFPDVDY